MGFPIPAPAGAVLCWEPAEPGVLVGGSTRGPALGAKTGLGGGVCAGGGVQGWPCLVMGSPGRGERALLPATRPGQNLQLPWVN